MPLRLYRMKEGEDRAPRETFVATLSLQPQMQFLNAFTIINQPGRRLYQYIWEIRHERINTNSHGQCIIVLFILRHPFGVKSHLIPPLYFPLPFGSNKIFKLSTLTFFWVTCLQFPSHIYCGVFLHLSFVYLPQNHIRGRGQSFWVGKCRCKCVLPIAHTINRRPNNRYPQESLSSVSAALQFLSFRFFLTLLILQHPIWNRGFAF